MENKETVLIEVEKELYEQLEELAQFFRKTDNNQISVNDIIKAALASLAKDMAIVALIADIQNYLMEVKKNEIN